jgi:hypothetical protein
MLIGSPIGSALVTYYAFITYVPNVQPKDVITVVLAVGVGFVGLQGVLTRRRL